MKLKLCLFLSLLLPLFSTYAQQASKLDKQLLNKIKTGAIDDGNVSLLVKGDLELIKALTLRLGGIYKYGYGTVASVAIPKNNVIAFSQDIAVRKIESTFAKGTAMMDTARIRNNIDSVQAGYAPLPDSILGKGVIIGIIDGGIYWQHKDFKNPDGTTRILYMWDQIVNDGNSPAPFGYGTEWDSHDINQGNCTEVEAFANVSPAVCASDQSHGTCVAGIAAGNGSSVAGDSNLRGVYTGVAPESNLIIVNIGTSGACVPSTLNFLSQISDGVNYIFQKANALGMPCVINISQGTYYGSHDGIDITSELIDSMLMLGDGKGRCVVAAAGNAGNIPYHLGYTVSPDTANPTFTLFNYNNTAPGGFVYFDLWADTANFNNTWFSFGVTDSLANPLGQTAYLNVPVNFTTLPPGVPTSISPEITNGTIHVSEVTVTVTLDEGRYHITFEIDNFPQPHDFFSLQTYGSGSLDIWASSTVIGTSDIVSQIITPLNDTIFLPANYRYPDYNKTIVSSFQCSDKVITVGNYSNRAGYLDVDSNYVNLTLPQYGGTVVGKIAVASSLGPTRDNRIKPDISATGDGILCTGDSNDIVILIGAGNAFKVGLGGKHIRNGGTSMSSPLVAGIAALYLQKRPTASYDEIKRALICTAVADSFTGTTPNNTYGYGKVNAFQALTKAGCFVYGATDTACINYNPMATLDTGGCVAKVYGCTDSTASNFNKFANVSSGGCIYTGIANVPGGEILIKAVPNPFSGQITFGILNSGYNFTTGSIEITDELGAKVATISVSANTANYVYDNPNLAAGIYFYQLKLDNKVVKTGKLVAQ